MTGLKHIFRRLLRYWRMNLLLLIGISFAAGLLASLPSFAITTANAALVQSIENATYQAKNVSILGKSDQMIGALSAYIDSQFGNLIRERLEVRQIQLATKGVKEAQILPVDFDERLILHGILGWSINRQSDLLQLVEGEWPKTGGEPPPKKFFDPPTFQVGIAKEAAAETGLKIGDVIVAEAGTKFKIVGVYEPKNPKSPIWYQDTRPFKLWIIPGLNEDTHLISLLLSRADLESLGSDQVEWRYLINFEKINPENAADININLINLKNQAAAYRVKFSSNLADILEEYLKNLSQVQAIVFLLGIQSFAFVIYSLIVLSGYANRQLESEIVVLMSRGASRGSIIKIFAIDRGLLALLAAIFFGPLLATTFLVIWSRISGEELSTTLLPTSMLLSIVGSSIGWLALILPIFAYSRRSLIDYQRQRARPETRTFWQAKYFDIFILVIGCLVYWQLSFSGGSFFNSIQNSLIGDPLLLLGPTVLLIGLALVFLRFFPVILKVFANLSKHLRGIGIKLSTSRLARDPVQPSQIILLITIATALTIFAIGFKDSLFVAQEQVSKYKAGSDLRIFQWRDEVDEINVLPGVNQTASVYRDFIQLEHGEQIEILAVDANSFANVTEYPDGMSNITIQQIVRVIRSPSRSDNQGSGVPNDDQFEPSPYSKIPINELPIPAVFSYASLPAGKGIGDQLIVEMKFTPILFEVRGIIADFPTAEKNYIIVNQSALQEYIDLNQPIDFRSREVWLDVADVYEQVLIERFRTEGRLISSAKEEWSKLSTNALAWGTQRTFVLNAAVLIILSLVSYLLMSYFSILQRTYEISVLRAEGLSRFQLVGLLISESVFVIFIGLGTGSLVGYSLLSLMRIYLSNILQQVLPGLEVRVLTIQPVSIGFVYFILLFVFGIALLLLMFGLQRVGLQRVLRLGEE